MKRKNIIYVLFPILFLFFAGCDSPPPKQYQPQSQAPPAKQQLAGEQASQSAAAQSHSQWPFNEKLGNVAPAANLLAKNYILVIDGSGSMKDKACNDRSGKSKMEAAKEAVREWIDRSLPKDANLGLVIFNNDNWIIQEIGSASREAIKADVMGIEPNSGTPLASALMTSYALLTKQAQSQLGYGNYTIVVITDGEDNDNRQSLSAWTGKILDETPIGIYTIGFCIGSNHKLNQPGRTVYREAGNLEEVRKGLADVVAEAESFNAASFKQ